VCGIDIQQDRRSMVELIAEHKDQVMAG